MVLDTLFIILVVMFLILTIAALMLDIFSTDFGNVYGAITITVGVIAAITLIFVFIDSRNPTAMDVYQGKTVLEVTYRGKVPIDSTVVFKERK